MIPLPSGLLSLGTSRLRWGHSESWGPPWALRGISPPEAGSTHLGRQAELPPDIARHPCLPLEAVAGIQKVTVCKALRIALCMGSACLRNPPVGSGAEALRNPAHTSLWVPPGCDVRRVGGARPRRCRFPCEVVSPPQKPGSENLTGASSISRFVSLRSFPSRAPSALPRVLARCRGSKWHSPGRLSAKNSEFLDQTLGDQPGSTRGHAVATCHLGHSKPVVTSSLCHSGCSGTRFSQIGNVEAFSTGLWKRWGWWPQAQTVGTLTGRTQNGRRWAPGGQHHPGQRGRCRRQEVRRRPPGWAKGSPRVVARHHYGRSSWVPASGTRWAMQRCCGTPRPRTEPRFAIRVFPGSQRWRVGAGRADGSWHGSGPRDWGSAWGPQSGQQ